MIIGLHTIYMYKRVPCVESHHWSTLTVVGVPILQELTLRCYWKDYIVYCHVKARTNTPTFAGSVLESADSIALELTNSTPRIGKF